MTEDEKHERALGLSPAQVVGSALAATSAAVLASLAGTAGTIIGAGVGSVVATIGAAVYTWWIRRTGEIARRTAAQMRLAALATQPLPRTVAQGPLRSRRARGSATGQIAGSTDSEPGSATGPSSVTPDATSPAAPDEPEGEDEPGFSLPWRKVLLATALVAVITLAAITTIEAVTGRPVSSITGGGDSDGTSVGHLVRSDDDEKKAPSQDETTPPATEEPSQAPDDETTDLPAPTPTSPPESEPSETPSVDPSPTESAAPGATLP